MVIISNKSRIYVASTAFDVKSYLSKFVIGTPHEAIPHGVPSSYNWYNKSTRCEWTGSNDAGCALSSEYKYANWWGVVYVDTTNYRAPNTRVNIWKDVKMLFLYEGSNQWEIVQQSTDPSKWGGAGYPEDWTGSNTAINKRIESDGSISYVPKDGYNSHFYPGPWITALQIKNVHSIVIAYTRLILDNPNGTDDRSSSKYIIEIGGDNRKSSGDQGAVQRGFGAGVFIKPAVGWRTVVMTSMSSNNLNTLPIPPAELFRMPDGNYPS